MSSTPAGRTERTRVALPRHIAWMALACALAALMSATPAVAKAAAVQIVSEAGSVQAGTPASAWFKVATGARCQLVGRHARRVVRGRTVRAHKPLLQYHWTVPARARAGTWRLSLRCSDGHHAGSATTKLDVEGPGRHGGAAFRRGMRPAQASLTTRGSGRGAGALPPYGTVLIRGDQWLGGGGVDVMSNGLIGCYNGCRNATAFGIAYQCVELIEHLIVAKGWSPKIWGDAYQIYDNASAQYFEKHPNGSGYTPVPGDVIVWHGGYGHVAVVEWVADGRIGWVEQNNSASGRGSGVLGPNGTLGDNGRLVPTGVLHAKANRPAQSPPPLQGSTQVIQGSSPPLQGGTPGTGGGVPPPAAPAPPAPPPPTVSLSKGASAAGQPGCTSSACAFLQVSFANFSGGTHSITCRASNGDEGGYYTYTRSGSADTSSYCYYGFPGATVWVTVDGVSSNQVPW
jgi:surface antigen